MNTFSLEMVRSHIDSPCIDQSSSSMSLCKPPLAAHSVVGPALLEHLDALYGYARVLTHSHAEAEDLVQDTCLRALRAEARLRPESHLKSWLFTILRNLFLNHLRKGPARAVPMEIDSEETPEAAWRQKREDDPETVLLRQTEGQQIRAALASLPALYREILVLREFEGLSYGEIAEVLHCPMGTVMSRLGRAREKLKSILQLNRPDTRRRSQNRGFRV